MANSILKRNGPRLRPTVLAVEKHKGLPGPHHFLLSAGYFLFPPLGGKFRGCSGFISTVMIKSCYDKKQLDGNLVIPS